MIERRRDYEKKEPNRDAHKVYVICEGASDEPSYFEFFKGLSSNLEIITIPSVDGKSAPLKLKEQAEAALLGDERKFTVDFKQGDTIWFVIDTDTWEKEGKIQILRDFCKEQNDSINWDNIEMQEYSAWSIAQSNPSFEIWLYYHSFKRKPTDEMIEQHTSFKEFVSKSYSGGFDYENDPVRISDAIENSKNNYRLEDNSIAKYSSEMHFLGCEIYNFVKGDIRRLRNKLKKG